MNLRLIEGGVRIARRGIAALMVLVAASCSGSDEPAKNEPAEGGERFVIERRGMVELLKSRVYKISDERVLEAMAKTPRHEFVPATVRDRAYEDRPLPIGYGQTISQPFIVAFMTEQLKPQPDEVILEVGTGSGYQAAVLSPLVKAVYSIEIVEPLAERSAAALERLGFKNVHVRAGDGYRGWPERAPFDAIIVTCAPEKIPKPLVEQLKEGGRMIIPVGSQAGGQELYLLEKRDGKVERKAVMPVRFVPMTGEGATKDGR